MSLMLGHVDTDNGHKPYAQCHMIRLGSLGLATEGVMAATYKPLAFNYCI